MKPIRSSLSTVTLPVRRQSRGGLITLWRRSPLRSLFMTPILALTLNIVVELVELRTLPGLIIGLRLTFQNCRWDCRLSTFRPLWRSTLTQSRLLWALFRGPVVS